MENISLCVHRQILPGIALNLNQIWIVITPVFNGRLSTANGIPSAVLNLSEMCDYNPNLVWINKIPKRFLCEYDTLLRVTDTPRRVSPLDVGSFFLRRLQMKPKLLLIFAPTGWKFWNRLFFSKTWKNRPGPAVTLFDGLFFRKVYKTET